MHADGAKEAQSANLCAAESAVPWDSENQLQLSVAGSFRVAAVAGRFEFRSLALAGGRDTVLHAYEDKQVQSASVFLAAKQVPRDGEYQQQLSVLAPSVWKEWLAVLSVTAGLWRE